MLHDIPSWPKKYENSRGRNSLDETISQQDCAQPAGWYRESSSGRPFWPAGEFATASIARRVSRGTAVRATHYLKWLTSSEEDEESNASKAKKNYPATSANQISLISCIGEKIHLASQIVNDQLSPPLILGSLGEPELSSCWLNIGRLVADSHVAHGSELGNSASGADLVEKKLTVY